MPEETAKEKGRIWEQKRVCSYCDKEHSGEECGFVHRNADGNPDWSICFACAKDAFDRMLGKKAELVEIKELCSYCGEQKEQYLQHFDRDGRLVWFICFDCLKGAFDNAAKEGKKL